MDSVAALTCVFPVGFYVLFFSFGRIRLRRGRGGCYDIDYRDGQIRSRSCLNRRLNWIHRLNRRRSCNTTCSCRRNRIRLYLCVYQVSIIRAQAFVHDVVESTHVGRFGRTSGMYDVVSENTHRTEVQSYSSRWFRGRITMSLPPGVKEYKTLMDTPTNLLDSFSFFIIQLLLVTSSLRYEKFSRTGPSWGLEHMQ